VAVCKQLQEWKVPYQFIVGDVEKSQAVTNDQTILQRLTSVRHAEPGRCVQVCTLDCVATVEYGKVATEVMMCDEVSKMGLKKIVGACQCRIASAQRV
jgi:hypothetical protein